MSDIINKLKKLMKKKRLSPEQAALYIGCSGRQIRRWLAGAEPSPIYRLAIQDGIERIKRGIL